MYNSAHSLALPLQSLWCILPTQRPCYGQGTQSSLHKGHRVDSKAGLPEASDAATCIRAKNPEVVLSPAGDQGDAKAQAEADTENKAVAPAEGVVSDDLQIT